MLFTPDLVGVGGHSAYFLEGFLQLGQHGRKDGECQEHCAHGCGVCLGSHRMRRVSFFSFKRWTRQMCQKVSHKQGLVFVGRNVWRSRRGLFSNRRVKAKEAAVHFVDWKCGYILSIRAITIARYLSSSCLRFHTEFAMLRDLLRERSFALLVSCAPCIERTFTRLL